MSTVKSKKLQVGTDASASNNFTIYQPATPDGTLRIGVGNADSPTEVGRFTSAGYKPQQPVAFCAYKNVDQTGVAANTATKVTFQAEEYDTSSAYDTSISRFTVPVTGYYHIESNMHYQGVNGQLQGRIHINGNLKEYSNISYSNGTNTSTPVCSLLYLTEGDYVEIYTRTATATTVYMDRNVTYFKAILISQA